MRRHQPMPLAYGEVAEIRRPNPLPRMLLDLIVIVGGLSAFVLVGMIIFGGSNG